MKRNDGLKIGIENKNGESNMSWPLQPPNHSTGSNVLTILIFLLCDVIIVGKVAFKLAQRRRQMWRTRRAFGADNKPMWRALDFRGSNVRSSIWDSPSTH